jgi:hypothetical protein
MTRRKQDKGTVQPDHDQRLAEVLAAYGRNPLRWPGADRIRFAHLIRRSDRLPPEAASAAARLDSLLDLAGPEVATPPPGAQQRLLDRLDAVSATVSPGAPELPAMSGRPAGLANAPRWLAAGMLAASVVFGVVMGATTQTGTVLAESLQLPAAADEVLDVVLAGGPDEGGLL